MTIVPNANMVEKTEPAVAERYLDFLVLCVERIRAHNLEPCILLHEANDARLLDRLMSHFENPPAVIDEDGAASKGYLGSCYANIGFRYHSLISSLSQATPSLASSWSHKYEALFATYGCPDCLISPALDAETAARHLDAFLQPERNEQLRRRLRSRAADQKEKVEAMWQRVEATLPGSNGAGGKAEPGRAPESAVASNIS